MPIVGACILYVLLNKENNMTRHLTTSSLNEAISSLIPFTVGMNSIFRDLETFHSNYPTRDVGYPPYNIEEVDENNWTISLAIAGFAEEEINVSQKERVLTISGKKETVDASEKKNYLHRGIATRGFERTFRLGPHVQVKNAVLKNGLLTVDLEQIIPEEERPKQIPVVTG